MKNLRSIWQYSVPETSGRVIALPETNQFVLIEVVVQLFLASLFPGYTIKESTVFHVLRIWNWMSVMTKIPPNIFTRSTVQTSGT